MNRAVLLFHDVKALANKNRAKVSQRFFKTGEGEYGAGDIFLGLTVPQRRVLAKKYRDLAISDVEKVLTSPIHEERLIALLILVDRFKKSSTEEKEYIYHFYLAHTAFINSWDLIDSSADKIVGQWLLEKFSDSKNQRVKVLEKLAKSDSVWERRIAIIATFQFIKNGIALETFHIAEILLYDKHDLIQKAVGWMLREAGKKCSEAAEEMFLKTRYKTMPRTMLRYAIEKFSEEKRKKYLLGKI